MTSAIQVSSICNALVDILHQASEDDLQQFALHKGRMHLVDAQKQQDLLRYFTAKNQIPTIELGGSSLNVLRTLALLQQKTTFAGKIGRDPYGTQISSRMEELKILQHLAVCPDEATGTCVVLVTKDGERTMVTHLGASRLYTADDVHSEDIKKSKIFHFCGYQWDTVGQKAAIQKAIEIAKQNHVKISFDIADPSVVSRHRQDFLDIIEHVDIIFANQEEAAILCTNTDPKENAKALGATRTAVIKLGSQGAIVQTPEETFMIAPVPTTVVDTTAAGDMFAGGFLYGMVSHRNPAVSGKIAATLASDVISRYGATLSPDVLKRAQELAR